MFLYQTTSLRRAFPRVAGLNLLLTLGLALGGCSHFRQHDNVSAPETPKVIANNPDSGAAAAEAQTVTSNLPDLPPDSDTTTIVTETTAPISPTAPKSYVVQRGDTLWGLANTFLKDPWLWPEIWYVNPEVSNPHRIYPGDTLRLAMGSDGKTQQVQVVHAAGSATRLEPLLRSTPMEAPIPNIPYSAIAAFLSRPGVLTKEQVEAAPYVLALRDRHMIAGTDNTIYVRKLGAAVGERYNVMHIADPLKDWDGGKMLGYLAIYGGTAQVTRSGNPASALITDSSREIVAGDVLVPDSLSSVGDIMPHVPASAVNGHVLTVVGGLMLAGQFEVVAINRGTQQGIEPGHVLRVNAAGDTVRDRCAAINTFATCTAHAVTLPQESSGTLLVFRVFDHVSYALVLSETDPIRVGDQVVRP